MNLKKSSPKIVLANVVWMISIFLMFTAGWATMPFKEISKVRIMKRNLQNTI